MPDQQRSPNAQAWQKWYTSKRWRKLRAQQLARHPYCQCPHHRGVDRTAIATVVDHKQPHRGDPRRFWNAAGLQSMTATCHNSHKQSQERGGPGFLKGCDEHGMPLSSEHHWHAAQAKG